MKKVRGSIKLVSLFLITITMLMISAKSSVALGNYEVNKLSNISGKQSQSSTTGEPAAVVAALVVGAVFVVAASVAFMFGVVQGVMAGGTDQAMLDMSKNDNYNPKDFSSFDI